MPDSRQPLVECVLVPALTAMFDPDVIMQAPAGMMTVDVALVPPGAVATTTRLFFTIWRKVGDVWKYIAE